MFFIGAAITAGISIVLAGAGVYQLNKKPNALVATPSKITFEPVIDNLLEGGADPHQISQLKSEFYAIAHQLDQVATENQNLIERYDQLTDGAAQIGSERDLATNKLNIAEQEAQTNRNEITDLTAAKDILQQAFETLKIDHSTLQQEQNTNIQRLSVLTSERETQEQNLGALNVELATLTEQQNDHMAQIETLTANNMALKQSSDTLQTQLATLEQELNLNIENLSAVTAENQAKEDSLVTLNAELAAATQDENDRLDLITTLAANNTALKQEQAQNLESLILLNTQNESTEKIQAELQAEVATLQKNIDFLNNDMARLIDENKTILASKSELETAFGALKQQRVPLQLNLDELTNKDSKKAVSATQERNQLQGQINILQQDLSAKTQQNDELANEILVLQQQLSTAKAGAETLSGTAQDLTAEPDGKLLLQRKGGVVGFHYDNADKLFLEYQLTLITQTDGPVALRGQPSLGNSEEIFIPIKGPLATYVQEGQEVEFELVIFNALYNEKSKAWRGKFRVDLETQKLKMIPG